METPEILDEKNLGYAISKRVLSDFNIEVLDPKSKYYLLKPLEEKSQNILQDKNLSETKELGILSQ